MFENITVQSKNDFNNLGSLCESLIFYQHTNLILDPGSLPRAIQVCGYNNLTELIRSGELSVSFCNQAFGAGNIKDNLFIISTLSSDAHKKHISIQESIENIYGRNIQSKNMATHLNRVIGYHNYSEKYQGLSKHEFKNKENLLSAISIFSKGKIDSKNVKLQIEEVKSGIYNIESNVDKQIIIDSAHIIANGIAQIYNAEMNNSALLSNNELSNYAANKINRIIQQRKSDKNQINSFHHFILPEYYDLQGTMDSGSKEFNDFMLIWREAVKFKNWLLTEEPSVELLTAYIRKISEKTWLSKLQTKNIRWLLFAGLGTIAGGEIGGVLGGGAALAIDYVDDLILDRLLNNWKPDQYIQGEYRNFLNLKMEY